MGPSSKKAKSLRQQASVESEVARAKLALAYQDVENGESELALRRTVEASFDAGVAHGYATEANQKKFQKETKAILNEARAIVAVVYDRAGVTDEAGCLACEEAYKAGVKYAKARNRNNSTSIQDALNHYEAAIDEIGVGRLGNPVPPPRRSSRSEKSVGRLKAKLLR